MRSSEKDFVDNFRQTQPKFSRLYACLLTHEGLSLAQYALLSELTAAARPLTMTELSRRLYITKPAVTSLADRLENNRFVRRRPHPSDRRVQLLEIQAKGLRAVKQTQDAILKILLQSFSRFNVSGQTMITSFYKNISSSIDALMKGTEKCN